MGSNSLGQLGLGDGTSTNFSIPRQVISGTAVAAAAAGGAHTAFLKSDGTLWAVGYNYYGQLGDGTTTIRTTPVQVNGGTNVAAVAANGDHTVFLKTDGSFWAMGYNNYGQLGDTTTISRSTPVQVSGATNVVAIAAGSSHTVFLKADGTLWGMGSNITGQLGGSTISNRTTPVQVDGATNVIAVAAGNYHTVFLKTDGTLWAVGDNRSGQLGDGTTIIRTIPVQVSGGTNVVAVAASGNHTVFLKTDGSLWATGDNQYGELGDGTTANHSTPVQMAGGGSNVVSVTAGYRHTVFVKTDGTLWAAGDNGAGQLGCTPIIMRTLPVPVGGGTNVAAITAGGDRTLFVKADGTLWATGYNYDGALGDGTTNHRATPVQVSGGTNVATVVTEGYYSGHTVFTKTDGSLWAVGYNGAGELGDGTTNDRTTPVQVSGGTNVATAAVGAIHTVFLKTDGTLWAMGTNYLGQLGDGTTIGRTTPVQVSGGTNVVAVAAGANHTVFLKANGTLWAVGYNNHGQLGDGTTTNRSTPVQVSGGTNVAAVAAGYDRTVFMKTNGTFWAVGSNYAGQLGDGTEIDRSIPVQVIGGTSVATAAVGEDHTAFVKTDGTLWTVGFNSTGQLGDGTTTDRPLTPIQVSGGSNVVAVTAGSSHTVFLKSDGSLWGVGRDYFGQLGNGTMAIQPTPIQFNQSPVLTAIGAKFVAAGAALNFTINAMDVDSDTLTYSVAGLPSGATFTPSTRTFSWIPIPAQEGSRMVAFSVTDGFGTASETITITVDTTVPAVPTNLSGTAASLTAILLTWTASIDNVAVAGYRVYRDGTQIGTSLSPSYSDTGLISSTTYSYTVAAYDAAGNLSAQSVAADVTTKLSGAQIRNVSTVTQLSTELAAANANPSATFTLNLAAGTYAPTIDLPIITADNLILKGPTATTPTAIIDGTSIPSGTIFKINADNVKISYLKLTNATTHAISVLSGSNSGSLSNCNISRTTAVSGAAIDGVGCINWTVTGNTLSGIYGTDTVGEPAIHFYGAASGTIITSNIILNCDRGIGLGNGASSSHTGGTIRNNMIADNRTTGNPGPSISIESTSAANVDNNTVYSENTYANAIEYSYAGTSGGNIRNNLANKPIASVSSGAATLLTNLTNAQPSWFVAPTGGDLHLASTVAAVNSGTTISGLTVDIDGDPRPTGSGYDIGADEYNGSVSSSSSGSSSSSSGSSSSSSSGGAAPAGGGGGATSLWYLCLIVAFGAIRLIGIRFSAAN